MGYKVDLSVRRVEDGEFGKCKFCHKGVAWLVSQRSGKKYPCDIWEERGDTLTSTKKWHNCPEREKVLGVK